MFELLLNSAILVEIVALLLMYEPPLQLNLDLVFIGTSTLKVLIVLVGLAQVALGGHRAAC